MRAAPSTMSSGGWKPCSAVLRSARCDGILVGHPAGVDAVHVDAVACVVGRGGARHHVQRGLRHVRVRVPGRLEPPVELPLDRRHVDDVLVALGRAQHQRLQARVQHERRDRVDELHLEQLDRRDLGEQQAPRVALAQVDLLQILVEPALRGRGRPARTRSSGSSGTCESSARAGAARRRQHLERAGPRTRRAAAHVRGIARRDGLALEHVPVELGRPAHGLAGVVDDEVEPVACRDEVPAERLDARRVAQVEAEDLEPVAPLLEVGLRPRNAPRRRAGSAS